MNLELLRQHDRRRIPPAVIHKVVVVLVRRGLRYAGRNFRCLRGGNAQLGRVYGDRGYVARRDDGGVPQVGRFVRDKGHGPGGGGGGGVGGQHGGVDQGQANLLERVHRAEAGLVLGGTRDHHLLDPVDVRRVPVVDQVAGTAAGAAAAATPRVMVMVQVVVQMMTQRRRRSIRVVLVVRRRRRVHRIVRTAPQRKPTPAHVQLPTEPNVTPRVHTRGGSHGTRPRQRGRTAGSRSTSPSDTRAGQQQQAVQLGRRARGLAGQRRLLRVEQILDRPQQPERLLGQLLRVNFGTGNWQSRWQLVGLALWRAAPGKR